MADDQRNKVWEEATLDASNSDLYEVVMVGDEVDWEFRDAPDYYDAKGNRRDGVQAPKRRAPASGVVLLRARSKQEAQAAAVRTHPEYHAVESVKKIG